MTRLPDDKVAHIEVDGFYPESVRSLALEVRERRAAESAELVALRARVAELEKSLAVSAGPSELRALKDGFIGWADVGIEDEDG